jgi:hypothetical protein
MDAHELRHRFELTGHHGGDGAGDLLGSSASISPSVHTALCGSATLMDPCRCSMAG